MIESNQRYLISDTNGRVFIWTPELHKRKDMRIASKAEAEASIFALDREAEKRVAVASSGGAEPGDGVGSGVPSGTPTIDDILGLTDKLAVEELARKFGHELDKRKSLKTLQSELITLLGLSVDE